MLRRLAGLCAVSGELAGSVSAQSSDEALPFRAGQWGAEFTLRTQAVGSILRFHAPDQAWALDVSSDGSWRLSGENDRFSTTGARLGLGLGKRHYRSLAKSVVGFREVGGSLGISRNREAGPTEFRVQRAISVGAFLGFGAQWFVLPRLSIGASARAGVTIGRESSEGGSPAPGSAPGRASVTRLGFNIGQFGLTGAIYF